jgi:hypothetical protein
MHQADSGAAMSLIGSDYGSITVAAISCMSSKSERKTSVRNVRNRILGRFGR